jgi:hypothetical protein
MAMDPYAAVGAGYTAGMKPLGIARTFDENARPPVRISDIPLAAAAVPATATTIATCPAGENWRIEHLAATNSDASARILRVYIVADGDSAADAANLVYQASIAADTSVKLDSVIGCQLIPGDTLQVIASTASVVVVAGRLSRITQGST